MNSANNEIEANTEIQGLRLANCSKHSIPVSTRSEKNVLYVWCPKCEAEDRPASQTNIEIEAGLEADLWHILLTKQLPTGTVRMLAPSLEVAKQVKVLLEYLAAHIEAERAAAKEPLVKMVNDLLFILEQVGYPATVKEARKLLARLTKPIQEGGVES